MLLLLLELLLLAHLLQLPQHLLRRAHSVVLRGCFRRGLRSAGRFYGRLLLRVEVMFVLGDLLVAARILAGGIRAAGN